MKQKRNIVFLLIALIIVNSLATIKVSAREKNHWAVNYVKELEAQQIINGYPGGDMKLDRHITRAEFVTMVNRLFNFTADSRQINNLFTDLQSSHWAYWDVIKAVELGYINGYPDNTFKPNNPLTREEASKIIASLLNYEEKEATKIFKDQNKISAWSERYIMALAEKSIVNGYIDGNFYPKKKITRAEISKILKFTIGDFYTKDQSFYQNNLIVRNQDQLEDLTIKGDLIFSSPSKLKKMKLKNIKLFGKIIVLSEALDEIYVEDSELENIESLSNRYIKVNLLKKSKIKSKNKNSKNIIILEDNNSEDYFEHPDDKPIEHPDDKPIEHPDDKPIEHPDDKPIEHPDDKPIEHPDECLYLNLDPNIKIDDSGINIRGEVSKDSRITFIIKDSEGGLVYSTQLDRGILDGNFSRYFGLENQPSGNYSISVSAWRFKEKKNKVLEFTYENLKALEDVLESSKFDFEKVFLEKAEDLLLLNFNDFYNLSYDEQSIVLENIYSKLENIDKIETLQIILDKEVSKVSKVKEPPILAKNLVLGRDFKIIDNYKGEDDRISFGESVVFDSDLKVRLLSLDKKTIIELKDSIQLSEASYTIPESSLGDLEAGKYVFMLQVEDRLGQTSDWNKDHLLKFELKKSSILEEAIELVSIAEKSEKRLDYISALNIVKSLEDGENKIELLKKLEFLDKQISKIEDQEKLLEEVGKLVLEAKSNKTRENYNKALELVKQMEDSDLKVDYMVELDKIDKYLNSLENNEKVLLNIISVYSSPKGAKVKVEFIFEKSRKRVDDINLYNMDIISHGHETYSSLSNFMDLVVYQEDGFGDFTEKKRRAQEEIKVNIYRKDSICEEDIKIKEAIGLIESLENKFDRQKYNNVKALIDDLSKLEAKKGLEARLKFVEETIPKEYEFYEFKLEEVKNNSFQGVAIVKGNIYDKNGQKQIYDKNKFLFLPTINSFEKIENIEEGLKITCKLNLNEDYNYQNITKENFHIYVYGPESDKEFTELIKSIIEDIDIFSRNYFGQNDKLFLKIFSNITELKETITKNKLLDRLKLESNYKYKDYFKENYEDIIEAKKLITQAEKSLNILDYNKACEFIKSKNLEEDFKSDLEKIKKNINMKESENFIIAKEIKAFKKAENQAWLWIEVGEIAESSINKKLKIEPGIKLNQEGIVELKGIDGTGINNNGKIELKPKKAGKTSLQLVVSDSDGNTKEITIEIIITKAQPKILRENLKEGRDYFVVYNEDKENFPTEIIIGNEIFEEENLEVRLYKWDDKNNDGKLFPEKEELLKDDYIVLGKTSLNSRGEVVLEKAKIQGYEARYKYILAIYDKEVERENDRLSRVSPDFEINFDRRNLQEKLLEINTLIESYRNNPSEAAYELIVIKIAALPETKEKDSLIKSLEDLKNIEIPNTVYLSEALFMDYNDLLSLSFKSQDNTKVEDYTYDFSKFIIEKDGEKFDLSGDYELISGYSFDYMSYKLDRGTIKIKASEAAVGKMKSYFPQNIKGIKLILEEGWCVNSSNISAKNMEIELKMDK